jgi:hypothetical protein
MRACILLHLHIQREKIVLRGSRAGRGTREEPGTLTQGGALFSLVPLVWESNPKLQVAGARPNHQPVGGSDPNHQGIWSPPRAGLDRDRDLQLSGINNPVKKKRPNRHFTTHSTGVLPQCEIWGSGLFVRVLKFDSPLPEDHRVNTLSTADSLRHH